MPIRWEKFTVKAQEAVQRASQLASEHGNPELQPIHLLAALLEDKENIVFEARDEKNKVVLHRSYVKKQ